MKFVADRSALLPALQRAARIVPGRGTIPILGHCLIEASRTRLSVTATDMDRAVTVSLEVDVTTPGSTTVDAKLLSQFVGGLVDGSQVELSLSDHKVTVRAGRARATFPALLPVDFPTMTAAGDMPTLAIEGKAFAALLGSVAHAMSDEETRYFLRGIYLHRRAPRELVAVATDGHMLGRAMLTTDEDLPEFTPAIVPSAMVGELSSLAEAAGTFELAIGETRLRAEAGNVVLTSKLVDGTFPDYERVIPSSSIAKGFDAARVDLLRALKRVAVFSDGSKSRTRAIKLTPHGSTVGLHSKAEGEGEIVDEIDARATDAATLGMNSRYLMAALEALDGADIQVRYADAGAPTVITDPADPTRLQVVMPLRVA